MGRRGIHRYPPDNGCLKQVPSSLRHCSFHAAGSLILITRSPPNSLQGEHTCEAERTVTFVAPIVILAWSSIKTEFHSALIYIISAGGACEVSRTVTEESGEEKPTWRLQAELNDTRIVIALVSIEKTSEWIIRLWSVQTRNVPCKLDHSPGRARANIKGG